MDFYKKLIPSQKFRFRVIKFFSFIPDKQMLQIQYFIKMHRKLNLDSSERFTEKIQWYKLYYRNEKMAQCADKYLVREYVKSKGLENILNELYGVYENPREINLDNLPGSFVLKLSNGGGTNIICRDKSELSQEILLNKFRSFTNQTETYAGREWVYRTNNPKIVAEKYLFDESFDDGVITDYKFMCFNGKPEVIICIPGRYTDRANHLYYDTDWNKINVVTEHADITEDAPKPTNLKEMLRVAEILSADFPFVRVDLYSIQNRIYFGELTFFPWSGYMEFEPDSFDFKLGEKFVLPTRNN